MRLLPFLDPQPATSGRIPGSFGMNAIYRVRSLLRLKFLAPAVIVIGLAIASCGQRPSRTIRVEFAGFTNDILWGRQAFVLKLKNSTSLPTPYRSGLEERTAGQWEPLLSHETMYQGVLAPEGREEIRFRVPYRQSAFRIRTEFHLASKSTQRIRALRAVLQKNGMKWAGNLVGRLFPDRPKVVLTSVTIAP